MGEDRKRAHSRALILGLGASVALHAAVLGWAGFSVPFAQSPEDGVTPEAPAPEPEFEVIRLVEVPDVDAPAEVAAAPLDGPAEGSPGAEGAPAAPDAPAEVAEAEVAATEPPPTPAEPDRARPVPERSRPDIRAQLEPPTLAVDVPYPATPPAPVQTAAAAPPADEPAATDGSPVDGAAEAANGEADEGAEGEEDGGGWGLGDLFRGISVTISAGGTCVPGLVNGPRGAGVTSINDRSPFGSRGSGGVGSLGPSGPTDPAAGVVGRLGGLERPGGTNPGGVIGRLGGLGGIGR